MLTTDELVASYTTDWTGRWSGPATCVVRPGTTAEVAEVLGRCAAAGVPVVPQGGNTGLVGGSVPHRGEVVLSTRRLAALGPVDEVAAQVTVGAGATLEAVQRHVIERGFHVGVDLAARGSATIGGMVATNAGGIHVVRHGSMRSRLVGFEAVLADGSVVRRLGGLVKDNTGYDLGALLCGSEGTLGVLTAVQLSLVPAPAHTVTAVVGLPSTRAALDVVGHLRRLPSLSAVELFHDDGARLVRAHAGVSTPFEAPVFLVVECAADADPTDDLASAVARSRDVLDVAVGVSAVERQRLWAVRERHTEAINAAGVPHKLDVTLPLSRLARFEDDVRAAVAAVAPSSRTFLFGHLADGNLHVNVVGAHPRDERVDDAVLRLVAQAGGSISAEHGIGVAKKPWLTLTRSHADIAAMRAVKRALDPAGILNPGVLFD